MKREPDTLRAKLDRQTINNSRSSRGKLPRTSYTFPHAETLRRFFPGSPLPGVSLPGQCIHTVRVLGEKYAQKEKRACGDLHSAIPASDAALGPQSASRNLEHSSCQPVECSGPSGESGRSQQTWPDTTFELQAYYQAYWGRVFRSGGCDVTTGRNPRP